MITLGIDTATSACAAAIWCAATGRVLSMKAEPLARGQAERLVPLIQETLAEAGLDFGAVDRYGVTVGPGTFTGLRIGLATARGLALASGRPLVGITSFEAAAHAVPDGISHGRTMLACIESRRDDLYLQAFGPDRRPLFDPADVLPPDLPSFIAAHLPAGPLLLVGDAAERTRAALGEWPAAIDILPSTGGPEASAVARLAALADPGAIAARPADPFYLRPPDVTLPKASGPAASGIPAPSP